MSVYMGILFGTDGIRGKANRHPMTAELAVGVGRAAAHYFGGNHHSTILIGRDTRISGYMLEHGVASGVCSAGCGVMLAGIVPTPAVAHLAAYIRGVVAGVVISASHNPFEDNGIKIFDSRGRKLPDAVETALEKLILDNNAAGVCDKAEETGPAVRLNDGLECYEDFLKKALPEDFSLEGMNVVLDCAHGAMYEVAPRLFSRLGAKTETLFDAPDGKNINDNCGSQHTETLRQKVLETGADVGFAFDGDGDRVISVDENGRQVTGDQMLAVCANHMKQEGTLKNNRVVSTVMSNLGLRLALKELDIVNEIADVGDRYVLEKMKASGAALGGEDSGHMIFLDRHTTGDGLLTALRVASVMVRSGKPLSALTRVMSVFPQVLMNVPVKEKVDLRTISEINAVIESVERRLGEEGRVLVRYSGTQLLCRIMVEGPDDDTTTKLCRQIVDVVKENIGQ